MQIYSPSQNIIENSLRELEIIAEWVNNKAQSSSPKIILIDGWAVDSYNPYFGSVDIDLVINSNLRHRLMYYLYHNHGYKYSRDIYNNTSISKVVDDETIIIDFFSKSEKYTFEGSDKKISLEFLDDNFEYRYVRKMFQIAVPTRSALLLLKLKAVWDRSYRIEKNLYPPTRDWDISKHIKDVSDVISLIDPKNSSFDLDIFLLGNFFEKYFFLKECLSKIPSNYDAIQKYSNLSEKDVKIICDQLMSIV